MTTTEDKELSPYEKFHTYWRGYADGVVCTTKRDRFMKHANPRFRDLYVEGYEAGNQHRITMQGSLYQRFDYTPNCFRGISDE